MHALFYSKDYYDNNVFMINVMITSDCNYQCKYCINSFQQKNIYLNLKQLNKFVLHLKKLTSKNIMVQILGGEPMLHKDIYEFCASMDKLGVECIILSNFSLDIEKYLSLLDFNVTFNLSYHTNRIFKNTYINNFYKIPLDKLNRFNFYIMYEHDYFNDDIQLFDEIKKYTHRVELKKLFNIPNYQRQYTGIQIKKYKDVVGEMRINNYTVEDVHILEKDGIKHIVDNSLIDEAENPFRYWRCNAGKDFLNIDLNGNIYPCVNLAEARHNLGNINNYQSFKLKQNILCIAQRCCIYDVKKENVLNKPIDYFHIL